MKARVLVADPPWNFSDTLHMSSTKRGASANYNTLTLEDLKSLPVKEIAENDAVLALWCPSSLLQEGLDVMKAWGFRQTQTHIWVKTKKVPLGNIVKDILKGKFEFGLDSILSFGMGRLFRGTHELVLIGVRGKVYQYLNNKSQRSVHFYPGTKHSTKPEALQDMLDLMFSGNKLEMFARRDRAGWICVGLECPSTMGTDIRDSLNALKNS